MINTRSHAYNGNDLFKISTKPAVIGNPAWADLVIQGQNASQRAHHGPGIYACFFENQLIYIGKFLGKKLSPFSGSVLSMRWEKHVGSMTLRAQKLSFSKKAFWNICNRPSQSGPVQDIRAANPRTVIRDRGIMSNYKRVLFAETHWHLFNAPAALPLELFDFLFVAVVDDPVSLGLSTLQIRKIVSDVESSLVQVMRPCCNACIPDVFGTTIWSLAAVKGKNRISIAEYTLPIIRYRRGPIEVSRPCCRCRDDAERRGRGR